MFLVSSPPANERTLPPFLKAVYRTTEPPGIAWSVEEGDTIMSKVAKSKGKTRGKRWKDRKVCWGARQRIEIQLSKLRFEARAHYLMGSCSRWFLLFLYQGWYLQTEKETSFLTSCMASFDLTATSLFRKSGRQWGAPPVPVPFKEKVPFYFSWQNGTFFLCWAFF